MFQRNEGNKIKENWNAVVAGKDNQGIPAFAQTQMASAKQVTLKATTEQTETVATKAVVVGDNTSRRTAGSASHRLIASPSEVRTQSAKISYPISAHHLLPAQKNTNTMPTIEQQQRIGKENHSNGAIPTPHSSQIAHSLEEFQRKRDERHKEEMHAIQDAALCEITNATITIQPREKPINPKRIVQKDIPRTPSETSHSLMLRSKTEILLERPTQRSSARGATSLRESSHGRIRSRSNTVPSGKCRAVEKLQQTPPSGKKRSYNPEDARRFMVEQKKKRRILPTFQKTHEKSAKEKEEIRKRLAELSRNTRKIVSKNLQKKSLESKLVNSNKNIQDSNQPSNQQKVSNNLPLQPVQSALSAAPPQQQQQPPPLVSVTRNMVQQTTHAQSMLSEMCIADTKRSEISRYKSPPQFELDFGFLHGDDSICPTPIAIEQNYQPRMWQESVFTTKSSAPSRKVLPKRMGLLRKPETKDHSFSAIREFNYDKENVAIAMLTPDVPPLMLSNSSQPITTSRPPSTENTNRQQMRIAYQYNSNANINPNWHRIIPPDRYIPVDYQMSNQMGPSPTAPPPPPPPPPPLPLKQTSNGPITTETKKKDSNKSDLAYWLRPSPVHVYPYNFIMAVRRKLDTIVNVNEDMLQAKQKSNSMQNKTTNTSIREEYIPSIRIENVKDIRVMSIEKKNSDHSNSSVSSSHISAPKISSSLSSLPLSKNNESECVHKKTSSESHLLTSQESISRALQSSRNASQSSSSNSGASSKQLPSCATSLDAKKKSHTKFREVVKSSFEDITSNSHRTSSSGVVSSVDHQTIASSLHLPPEKHSQIESRKEQTLSTSEESTTAPSSVFGSPEKKPPQTGKTTTTAIEKKNDRSGDGDFLRPLSPLSLERVVKLKMHLKMGNKKKVVRKEELQQMHPSSVKLSDGYEKKLADPEILPPPLSPNLSQHSSVSNVDFNQLLDDFNRSLSQVIHVNEQLKSTLDKSNQLYSPRERIRAITESIDYTSTTKSTIFESKAMDNSKDTDAATGNEDEYTSDFENSAQVSSKERNKNRNPISNPSDALKLLKKDLYDIGRVKPLQLTSPTSDINDSEIANSVKDQSVGAPPSLIELKTTIQKLIEPSKTFSSPSSLHKLNETKSHDDAMMSIISPLKAQLGEDKSLTPPSCIPSLCLNDVEPEYSTDYIYTTNTTPQQGHETFILRKDQVADASIESFIETNDKQNDQTIENVETSIEEELQNTILNDSGAHQKLTEENVNAVSNTSRIDDRNKHLATAHYIQTHVTDNRGDFIAPPDEFCRHQDEKLRAEFKKISSAAQHGKIYVENNRPVSSLTSPPSYRTVAAGQPGIEFAKSKKIHTLQNGNADATFETNKNEDNQSIYGGGGEISLAVSQLLAGQNDTLSESSANYSSVGLYKQLIQTETTKSEHLTFLLKLREKALLDRTKGQISLLEAQKERYKTKGLNAQIAIIKKKQRNILLKMTREREEIKRLLQSASSPVKSSEDQQQQQSSNNSINSAHLSKDYQRRSNKCNRELSLVRILNDSKTSASSRGGIGVGDVAINKSPSSSIVSTSRKRSGRASSSTQFLRATYELEPSRSLEQLLKRREEDLRRRREHVEHLMQWHRRLDQEEAEVLELEKQLLGYNNIDNAHSMSIPLQSSQKTESESTKSTKSTKSTNESRSPHKQNYIVSESNRKESKGGVKDPSISPCTPTKLSPTSTKFNTPTKNIIVVHSPRRRVRANRMERRLREIDRSLRELSGIAMGHGATSVSSTPADSCSESGPVETMNGTMNGTMTMSTHANHEFIPTSGNKLNKLWKRLTAQQTEKFEPNKRYKLCKADLERLYEEAKIAVLEDFARNEEKCAAELLERSVSHFSSSSNRRVPSNIADGHDNDDDDDERTLVSSLSTELDTENASSAGEIIPPTIVPPLHLSSSSLQSEQEDDDGIGTVTALLAATTTTTGISLLRPEIQGDYSPRAAQEDFYKTSNVAIEPKRNENDVSPSTETLASTLSLSSPAPSECENVGMESSCLSSSVDGDADETQRQMQKYFRHVQRQHRINVNKLQRSQSDTQIKEQQSIQILSNVEGTPVTTIVSQRNINSNDSTSASSIPAESAENLITNSPKITEQSIIMEKVQSSSSLPEDGTQKNVSTIDLIRDTTVIQSVGHVEALKVMVNVDSIASNITHSDINSITNSTSKSCPSNNSKKSKFCGQVPKDDVESEARLMSEKLDEIASVVARFSMPFSPPSYQQSTKAEKSEENDITTVPTMTSDKTRLTSEETAASYSTRFDENSTEKNSSPTESIGSISSNHNEPSEVINEEIFVRNSTESLEEPEEEEDFDELPSQAEYSEADIIEAVVSTDFELSKVSSEEEDKEKKQSTEENEQMLQTVSSDAYELEFESSAISEDQTFIGDMSLPNFDSIMDITQERIQSPEGKKVSNAFQNDQITMPTQSELLPLASVSSSLSLTLPSQKNELPLPPPLGSPPPAPAIQSQVDVVRRDPPQISPAEEELLKQLEHITAVPYYVREIPNKPPPPYVPPAHGSPMTTIFPAVERIEDITYRRTHELYCEMQGIDYVDEKGTPLPSVIDEKITNIYERIILDICREYLQEHQDTLSEGDPTNYHRQLAFFNPPNRLHCLQQSVYKEVRRCLAMDKTSTKRSQVYSVYGQRANRDHIGKIIIQEMYDEDEHWCTSHREEDEVLKLIIEEMEKQYLENIAKEVLLEEGGTIDVLTNEITQQDVESESVSINDDNDSPRSDDPIGEENNLIAIEISPVPSSSSSPSSYPSSSSSSAMAEQEQKEEDVMAESTNAPFARDTNNCIGDYADESSSKENSLVNILCPS